MWMLCYMIYFWSSQNIGKVCLVCKKSFVILYPFLYIFSKRYDIIYKMYICKFTSHFKHTDGAGLYLAGPPHCCPLFP